MSAVVGYRQYLLRAGTVERPFWLREDPSLHIGRRLMVKGDDRVWIVQKRYSVSVETPPDRLAMVARLL